MEIINIFFAMMLREGFNLFVALTRTQDMLFESFFIFLLIILKHILFISPTLINGVNLCLSRIIRELR